MLAWYDANRRDLPWRQTTDPYRIWVSEIMLQQTRVEGVIPYYERWLATFPDMETLAAADLHEVLKLWEGLGYYARARNLHSAARVVREQHGGDLPRHYADLRALPGIGSYTAGAIASIAYNKQTPAVDGNVRRVLARLFDVAKPMEATTRARAATLLDPLRPGDFNQALMDLGALICTPRSPRCSACPLACHCLALARATVDQRPARTAKRTIPHENVRTLVAVRHNRVLIERRESKGLLGGLWQFPEISKLPKDARLLGTITHTFSHKRVTYNAYLGSAGARTSADGNWVSMSDLHTFAMPAAQRRIEALLKERR